MDWKNATLIENDRHHALVHILRICKLYLENKTLNKVTTFSLENNLRVFTGENKYEHEGKNVFYIVKGVEQMRNQETMFPLNALQLYKFVHYQEYRQTHVVFIYSYFFLFLRIWIIYIGGLHFTLKMHNFLEFHCTFGNDGMTRFSMESIGILGLMLAWLK